MAQEETIEPQEARREPQTDVGADPPVADPMLSPQTWDVRDTSDRTFSEALVSALASLGVHRAFGIVGGANTPFVQTLERSSLQVVQYRHEGGAAFAAAEAYFEEGRPVCLFLTTGPGLFNALNGIAAARHDGSKVIVVSGATAPIQKHRFAIQESHVDTLPPDLYASGKTFDFATRIEDPQELELVRTRLSLGLLRPGPFVAHLAVPMSLQRVPVRAPVAAPRIHYFPPVAPPEALDRIAATLARSRFAVWLGFGARDAWKEIRELVRRAAAPVYCSARAKGVVSERDPWFAGHSGVGGSSGTEYAARAQLEHVLVLGSRIGEGTSFWDERLIPSSGFIHVDLDPQVAGRAFPATAVEVVHSDVRQFVAGLLERLEPRAPWALPPTPPRLPEGLEADPSLGCVRPHYLLREVQRVFVDGSDALIASESGNAFSWANEFLQFEVPGRYRTSSTYGSMGHFCAGAVGAAMCQRRACVVLTGDGALLMNNEINTAVTHGSRVVWIVINDARYGMVEHGTRLFGRNPIDTRTARVDFAALARSLGATGIAVDDESQVTAALERARAEAGPVVIDVKIAEDDVAPLVAARGASLLEQA